MLRAAVAAVVLLVAGFAHAELPYRVGCLFNQATDRKVTWKVGYKVQFCGSNPRHGHQMHCTDWSPAQLAYGKSRPHSVNRDIYGADTYMRVRFSDHKGGQQTIRMATMASATLDGCVAGNSATFKWNYEARQIQLVKGKP